MLRYARLLIFALTLLLTAQTSLAQAPEGINYQAVARDGSGNILTNQSLTVRMTIKESGPVGTTVHRETHNATTNDFGLFDVVIGQGDVETGDFSSIDWGNSSHFLQVEVDPDGTGYVDLGTTQFVSVPYALYAKEAGNAGGGGDDWGNQVVQTDATLAGDGTSGNLLSVDGDITDDQTLSISGSNLSISNGNTVTLPGGGQTYSAGSGINITGSNVIENTAPDQTVNISGSGATSVSGSYPDFTISSTDNNTTYSAGTGLNLSGTTFNAQNDNAIWNAGDLQGNEISSTTPTVGDVLRWDGSEWVPELNTDTSHWKKNAHHIFTENDSVGIGTDKPMAALHVDGNQGVLFNHTATGGSAEFIWLAEKGALRAGSDNEGNWHLDSIGIESAAFGNSTRASGLYSFAMGDNATASGSHSTAIGHHTTASNSTSTSMGYYTTASGRYSTAMGNNAHAYGWNSTAMGNATLANGLNSTAMGQYSTASGDNSTALGFNTIASGPNSIASGLQSTASGSESTAIGNTATASGFISTALGTFSTASGDYSIAIGTFTEAPSGYETAMGRHNTEYTPQDTEGWDSDDRLFVIGNGTGPSGKSDAMVMLKNGSTGFGVSDPDHKVTLAVGTNSTPNGDGLGLENTTSGHYWNIHMSSDYLRFSADNSNVAYISDITGSYNQTSDQRLKENIQPNQPLLAKVNKLNVVSYNYRHDEQQTPNIGLLAQEVMPLFPELVSKDEGSEYYGLNYSGLGVIAIKAIQEQQVIIDNQQAIIERQEKENQAFRKELNRIKSALAEEGIVID